MYDTLLFLHVLTAVALFTPIVIFSAWVFGGPVDPRSVKIIQGLAGIGGIGTLIFGVWLAIYVDGYEVWDGWVLLAIVLWFFAMGAGERAGRDVREAEASGSVATIGSRAAGAHWVRTVLIIALLAVMVWKPGA